MHILSLYKSAPKTEPSQESRPTKNYIRFIWNFDGTPSKQHYFTLWIWDLWRHHSQQPWSRRMKYDMQACGHQASQRFTIQFNTRRWTYSASCRRCFAASPVPIPLYHLNITRNAAVCRRLYFYTTKIKTGQSQRTDFSGYVTVGAHWYTLTYSDACPPRDAWCANEVTERSTRVASPQPCPLPACTMHRRTVRCTASTWLRAEIIPN